MLVMTLLICGAVLLVAIAALFIFQVLNFRSNFQRDTSTLAAIIANQSTAVMQFKDDVTATEVVGALQAKPTVLSASLVLPDGSLVAHFGKAEDAKALSQFPPPGESRFTGEHLLLTQPVILKGEQVGTLYLRTDYQRTFLALLGFYGSGHSRHLDRVHQSGGVPFEPVGTHDYTTSPRTGTHRPNCRREKGLLGARGREQPGRRTGPARGVLQRDAQPHREPGCRAQPVATENGSVDSLD